MSRRTGKNHRPCSLSDESFRLIILCCLLTIINFLHCSVFRVYEQICAISMHSPTAREVETKAAISRPTFRFAPHNDRTTADLSSDPMATADEEKSGTALRLKTNLQPEIPARTDSIIVPPAKAEKEDLHSASNHCSLCSVTSPILCPRHKTGDNKPPVDAEDSTVLSTNHHRRKQSSETTTKTASQTASTKDAKKTPKTVQVCETNSKEDPSGARKE